MYNYISSHTLRLKIKVSTEIIRLNIMADSEGVSFTFAISTKVE